ncbi:MAG: hypothetical protein ACYDAY_02630 [Candidatus Dormibacteria bacterium]
MSELATEGWVASLRAAVAPFVVSRLLVLLGMRLGADIIPPAVVDPRASVWSPLVRWFGEDAYWYHEIWTVGYGAAGGHPAAVYRSAFWPLYPALVHLAGGEDLVGLVLPWIAFGAALLVFHRLAMGLLGPEPAGVATWVMALWPFSFFFSLPYAESLFLLLTVLALWLAGRRAWLPAALAGAAAAATRAPGVLLSLTFLADALVALRRGGMRLALFPALAAAAPAAGLAAFMAVLLAADGSPLLFLRGQSLWVQAAGRPPWFPVTDAIARIAALNPFNLASWSLAIAVLGLAVVPWAWRRLPRPVAIFHMLFVGLAVVDGYYVGDFASVPRHLLPLFTIYLAIAALLVTPAGRRWREGWFVASGAFLTVFTALFSGGNFLG